MRAVVCNRFLPFVLTSALAAGAGCSSTATPTTPTSPIGFTSTETFTGTLTTNGAQSFSFNVTTAGTVTVTLTSLADIPNTSVTPPEVGLSMGTWNGTACSVQTGIFTDNASQGASVSGNVGGAGALCARIYDPASRVTDPLAYTITVTHP